MQTHPFKKTYFSSSGMAVGPEDDFETIDDDHLILFCDETFDESFDNFNECSFASEEDLFEIFVSKIVQDSIEQDGAHKELFMEEEIGEDKGEAPHEF